MTIFYNFKSALTQEQCMVRLVLISGDFRTVSIEWYIKQRVESRTAGRSANVKVINGYNPEQAKTITMEIWNVLRNMHENMN